jgi:hypothetical protein
MIIVRNVFALKFGKARDAMEAYREVVAIARQAIQYARQGDLPGLSLCRGWRG